MSETSQLSINYDDISQQLKVRPDILKRLIKSFAMSLSDKMKNLEEALAQNDALKMRSILHEIKGTAGNLRLDTISTPENIMHEAVKAGEDPQKLRGYLTTLKQKVEELQQYVSKES